MLAVAIAPPCRHTISTRRPFLPSPGALRSPLLWESAGFPPNGSWALAQSEGRYSWGTAQVFLSHAVRYLVQARLTNPAGGNLLLNGFITADFTKPVCTPPPLSTADDSRADQAVVASQQQVEGGSSWLGIREANWVSLACEAVRRSDPCPRLLPKRIALKA